jgi:nucleoside-diphosphate-sugar epimerase
MRTRPENDGQSGMLVLVTGAAGFIGSHLCELLLDRGHRVRAVDGFTGYYPRSRKERNIAALRSRSRFDLIEADLAETPLSGLLEGVDVVYHLAAQPGVRPSWGRDFDTYVHDNVVATQRLLEALKDRPPKKLIYASSSSVYGNAETLPTSEDVPPQPFSPYGVTKLAAEHLCELYRKNFGVPSVSLRLFTVYGPRQRPDMALGRLIRAVARGDRFELYGDGKQTRDFTFVGDVVRAMHDAAVSDWEGVANVGGGHQVSLNRVISLVEKMYGPVELIRKPKATGDVRHTAAETRVARAAFGFEPRTSFEEGLEAMVQWERSLSGAAVG